jgi:hypothetical protein
VPPGLLPDKPGYHAVQQDRMLKDGEETWKRYGVRPDFTTLGGYFLLMFFSIAIGRTNSRNASRSVVGLPCTRGPSRRV